MGQWAQLGQDGTPILIYARLIEEHYFYWIEDIFELLAIGLDFQTNE